MKNPNAFRGGSYSLTISIVVLAILIVVNIFASALPTAVTKYDISVSKLYSITSNTKVVVNALEQDVTIYWVVQSGQEDEMIENLLGKYDSLSDHIQVVKKNPDVYPTFAEQYTDETVMNNSLIVECGDCSRFIGYDDIYVQEADIYSYSYNTSFDGEGAITSAIDYVVSEELPQVYILEGHGEADLPASFQEQLKKENMETNTLSLLTVDAIPEDADCVMIYAPESDISQEEKDLLADYAADGGKLFVVAGPVQDGILENLYDLLVDYGVEANEGIVVEGDREHYSFQGPAVLLPDVTSDTITDSLIDENYYPIIPISLGLTVTENTGGGAVTELLTTSYTSYSKLAGYSMTDYEKEDGDIDGPFLAGPFSPAAFSSGAGVGGCSGSGGSFFSTSARPAARCSAMSFSIWSADTLTSPGAPAGASWAGASTAACSGMFSGAGGSGADVSGAGASAGPVSNKLGWGFSSGLTFNFSSAIRYLLF